MRNRFDQLGKQIGCQALGPSGPTVAHDEIAPDAQHADLRHEPDPRRAAERTRLGLLGRFAAVLCLIEIYSHAPDDDDVLTCLGKLIAFRNKRARVTRGRRSVSTGEKPFLWIITAGRPSGVLGALGASPAPDWPAGVYFAADLLRVGIVVAAELPRERSTLLVRLMAAGPLLVPAIEDLARLPADAHERAVAEQILLRLQHALGDKANRTPEEQEFIMTMHSTWEDARDEGRKEGRDEGRKEGRAEEAAHAVLAVCRVRGLAVSDAVRERILAEQDVRKLERWHERAVVAASVEDVTGTRLLRVLRASSQDAACALRTRGPRVRGGERVVG